MRLLLAVDGSAPSQAALQEIASRPWAVGTAVEVVHVVEHVHLWTTSATAEELVRRGGNLLTGAVAQLSAGGLRSQAVMLHGDPKRAILEHAAKTDPDWIVAGPHSSATTRFLMGNVASALLHYAPCSVEIVRSRVGTSECRKILLATDGSPSSEVAARSIAERPWPAGSKLRVLSVLELGLPPLVAMLEPPFIHSVQVEEFRAAAMKRAEDAVQSACGILAATFPGLSQSISVMLEGPRRVIVDEAAAWGADMIVLGSHGHRGMDHFLLGSVSQAVAMHANCSVEVVRGI